MLKGLTLSIKTGDKFNFSRTISEKYQFQVLGVDLGGGSHKIIKQSKNAFLVCVSGYTGWRSIGTTQYYSPELRVFKVEPITNTTYKILEDWSEEYNRTNKKEVMRQAEDMFNKFSKGE